MLKHMSEHQLPTNKLSVWFLIRVTILNPPMILETFEGVESN